MVADDELDAEVLGPHLHEVDALRVHLVADEELVLALGVHSASNHRHGLRTSRTLVQQRGVGYLHACELADESLEVDQRLQPSLGDLGLVRRVGGVPARVLQHVAQDDARRVRAVVAHTNEVLGLDVLAEDLLDHLQGSSFSQLAIWQDQSIMAADLCWDGLVDELVDALDAYHLTHLHHVSRRRTEMAFTERVGWAQEVLD
mmetsp:Transcript_27212/g.43605  ORF Transcript_27212/g.43605 Transcript_27212/m.43605 type:complete len:202 (-) Transcript_27212:275-880(-)